MEVILEIWPEKVKNDETGGNRTPFSAQATGRRHGKNVKMAVGAGLPCFYICHIMPLTMKNQRRIARETIRAVFCGNPRFTGSDK